MLSICLTTIRYLYKYFLQALTPIYLVIEVNNPFLPSAPYSLTELHNRVEQIVPTEIVRLFSYATSYENFMLRQLALRSLSKQAK